MRNLACGDQWILLVVTWPALRRAEIEEIKYYQEGLCVSWPYFQGRGEVEESVGLLESQCTFIWGENQKKKFLSSNPVEALMLFNEEH